MKIIEKPCGLNDDDTMKDALSRADSLATPTSHSGMMCSRKDLRRIVLLAYEYRKLKEKFQQYRIEEYGG